jgi:parallel beta-helix repeat protein
MKAFITNDQGRIARRTKRHRRRLHPSVMTLEGRALLSTIVVNNPTDTPVAGQTDLRQAITQANGNNRADTIVFSPSVFDTPQTITLSGGPLTLTATATTTIDGPGANLLTVSGGGNSRVFDIDYKASAVISGLTVSGGSADTGGGLLNLDGTLILTDVAIIGNTATAAGGGLATQFGGMTTLVVCLVSGNTAVMGGAGLLNASSTMSLLNTTVTTNTATSGGGGLECSGGTTTLTNDTVTANAGGGLAVASGTATLTNTIVAANTSGDIAGALQTQSASNLVGNGSGMTGISNGSNGNQVGTAQSPIAPELSALGDYGGPTFTMALLPGSPAIARSGALTALSPSGVPDTSSTAIPVANGLAFAASSLPTLTSGYYFVIQVDHEQMAVVGLTLNADNSATLDVVRGVNGTAAAKHSGGVSVFLASDQRGHTRGSNVFADLGAFQTQSLITVSTTVDGTGSGPGQISLRQAINLANALTSANTIDFDPTVFATPQTITLTAGQLTLTDKAMTTINGPGANLLTVSGGGNSRVIEVDGGSATISGLTITDGHAQSPPGGGLQSGGGIWNNAGTLDLSHATVTNNYAQSWGGGVYTESGTTSLTDATVSQNSAAPNALGIGGGLANLNGTTTVTGGTIEGNRASSGGGLYNGGGGTVTLTNVTVSGNSASKGGGAYSEDSTLSMANVILSGNHATQVGGGSFSQGYSNLSMTNVTLSGNTAGKSGGGLYNKKSDALLTNCNVSGNSAPVGAGLFSAGNYLTLTNSTVSGNTASQQGGGLYGSSGSMTLINCTVSANSAPTGGGLVNSQNAATVALTNTIVAKQTSGGDIAGAVQAASANNLIGDGSGMTGIENGSKGNLVGTASAPIDPKLSPLGDYGGPTMTMVPLPGSLAIGGGTTGSDIPSTDQRGFARGSSIDIGAFQGQGTTLVVNTTVDGFGVGPAQLSLRQAINLANVEPTFDPITFDPNVFKTPQTITLAGTQLELANTTTEMTITAPAAGLTVSGGGTSRVFQVDAGVTASISGLTITGGKTAANGGGLYNDGGNVMLTNCTISGNSSSINVESGGGGGVRAAGGTTALTNCTVSDNSAFRDGGGLSADPGTMTLTNCTVSGNSVQYNGGGLFIYGATLTMTNCTVSGNSAGHGGGNGGGGLQIYRSTATLTNCTVTGNSATGGGGLENYAGTTTLTNTIVAGQKAGGDISGALRSDSANNLIGNGTGMSGISNGSNGNQVGTASAPINPFLSPLGNYGGPTQTMGLLPGSPGIGAGTTGTDIPTTDQRGQERSGHVDIGAFQSGGFTLTLVVGSTPQKAVIGKTFAAPLAVMVTANNPVEPVNGGAISFAAVPVGGSSASLSSPTATIVNDVAGVSATANNVPGQYTVTATAAGVGASVSFTLTNTPYPSLVVNTTQDVINSIDGTTSLREAIEYALTLTTASTITFSPAVFSIPQIIVLTLGELSLSNAATITIAGPGASLLTISGNSANRVFDVTGSAALSGLTITHGMALSGAGLENDHGTLELTDCTVTNNTASLYGGGLFANGGTTSLADCTISGNSAALGAGVESQSGTIALSGSSISRNTAAGEGGGLRVVGASAPTVTDCTINNNTAKVGAGVSNEGATLTMTGCTVSGNSAAEQFEGGGGIIEAEGGSTMLINCTVSGNSTTNGGGGMYARSGSATLINCTVSGNSAATGGGVEVYSGASVTLVNTIVAGQTSGGDVAGSYTDGGGNLIGGSPLLAPLGDYGGPTLTMPPLPGSNAIGGGTTGTGVPATDQRGFARGASIDIGAFQTQGPTLLVNVTSDGVGSGSGQLSLRQAVNLADAQTTGDSISFDPSVFGTAQVINLTDGPLSLSDAAKTTIAGPGAGLLTISGQSKSRVFDIPGSAALSGMTITGGLADNGGGLRNDGGRLSLTNVSVSGNVASNDGGGIYTAPGGSTTLTDVTVSNNNASVGGGIAVASSAASTLSNCTISGNSASSNGTGVASLGGTLSLVNVTISANKAVPANGPAAGLSITGSGSVTLRNTIVAAQASGGDVAGALQSGSANNLIGNGSGMTGIGNGTNGNQVGTALAPINPLLAPLASYGGPTPTMALLPGSPAIGGGGSGLGVPTTDQRGESRVGHVDIGAFQSQGFVIKTVAGSTPQSVQVNQPFKSPLAVTVTANNPVEPVNGGVVSFVANPNSDGASAILSRAMGEIGGGLAAVSATANDTPGPYSVTASALGAGSAIFTLSNIEIPGVTGTPKPIVVNVTDGLTGLREAIAYANSHPGPDTIILDPPAGGAKPRMMTLTGGPLVLTDPATTRIIGPGARRLSLSGGGRSGVFDIEGGSLDLSGVTITGGRAGRGGGILNDRGRLSLSDVVIRENRANMGGGLYNDGRTTFSRVLIEGNHATVGPEVFNTRAAMLFWRGSPAK